MKLLLNFVIVLSVAAPPTNLSAEMISPTTVSVSWQPPSDGPTVTGYLLSYTDQNEDANQITLYPYNHSYSVDVSCDKSMNITLQALSRHFPSLPVNMTFFFRKYSKT